MQLHSCSPYDQVHLRAFCVDSTCREVIVHTSLFAISDLNEKGEKEKHGTLPSKDGDTLLPGPSPRS